MPAEGCEYSEVSYRVTVHGPTGRTGPRGSSRLSDAVTQSVVGCPCGCHGSRALRGRRTKKDRIPRWDQAESQPERRAHRPRLTWPRTLIDLVPVVAKRGAAMCHKSTGLLHDSHAPNVPNLFWVQKGRVCTCMQPGLSLRSVPTPVSLYTHKVRISAFPYVFSFLIKNKPTPRPSHGLDLASRLTLDTNSTRTTPRPRRPLCPHPRPTGSRTTEHAVTQSQTWDLETVDRVKDNGGCCSAL